MGILTDFANGGTNEAPDIDMPELVDKLKPIKRTDDRREHGTFIMDTNHGFKLIFTDGRPRTSKNLPESAIRLFDPSPLCKLWDYPLWLFFFELGPATRKTGERYGEPDRLHPIWWSDGFEHVEPDESLCCLGCGRSLFWRDFDGDENCVTCHPRKWNDDRDKFREYFKKPGCPDGLDWFDHVPVLIERS